MDAAASAGGGAVGGPFRALEGVPGGMLVCAGGVAGLRLCSIAAVVDRAREGRRKAGGRCARGVLSSRTERSNNRLMSAALACAGYVVVACRAAYVPSRCAGSSASSVAV